MPISKNQWRHKEEALKSNPRFSWLSKFGEAESVDAIVFRTTERLASQALLHDPYQLETLLSSASFLLDRCLVYRREMQDLEEAAVKHAFEYELFGKQLETQREIEMADHIEGQRTAEMEGQLRATEQFSLTGDNLGAGSAAVSDASAASSKIAVEAEKRRKVLVEKKWNALADYQNTLEDRHNTHGHALNYGDRFDRIKAYFQQDVSTAFLKVRSIELGLKRIFAIALPLDAPRPRGFLDHLVQYVRTAIERLELEAEQEIKFTHVVSLHQPRALSIDGKSTQKFDDARWNDSVGGDGRLVFDLISEFPATITRLRVRGLAASILTDDPIGPRSRQGTIAIVVFPPPTPAWSAGRTPNLRNPVIIERVGPEDQAISPSNQTSLNNIDPRGTWEIQVSTNLCGFDLDVHSRSATRIKDIRLHLSLASTVEKDASHSAWRSFNL